MKAEDEDEVEVDEDEVEVIQQVIESISVVLISSLTLNHLTQQQDEA